MTSPDPRPHDSVDIAQPTVGEEVRATLLAMLPWVATILLWLAILLVALLSTLFVLDTAEEPDVSKPTYALEPAPQINIETPSDVQEEVVKPSSPIEAPQPSPLVSPVSASPNMTMTLPTIGVTSPIGGSPLGPDGPKGPDTTVFPEPRTPVSKVVYVVDASGSLLDTLPHVMRDLSRSINGLSPEVRFTVLFFYGETDRRGAEARLVEMPQGGLTAAAKATDGRKAFAAHWLSPEANSIQPGLRGDAVAAIKKALSYQPDLIYLLSDNITGYGRYEVNQQDLLNEVQRANRSMTQIDTIQFVYPDPLTSIRDPATGKAAFKPTLQMIAERTGGTYTFVSQRDLGLR